MYRIKTFHKNFYETNQPKQNIHQQKTPAFIEVPGFFNLKNEC